MTPIARQLRGVIPPMATPLLDDGALDLEGVDRLLDQLLEGGVHGVFLLGTTSEGASLSYRVRYQLVERVGERLNGRALLLVGVSDTSLAESLDAANHAFGAGAAAVVATPPYFLPIGQSQLIDYTRRLADDSPLPLVLYNIPMCTKTAFEYDTIMTCRGHDNIVGVKDTSCDMDFFARLAESLRDDDDFALLIGPEDELGKAVALGADGGVCGGANMFPRLYVGLFEAAAAEQAEQVAELEALAKFVVEQVYRVGPEFPTSIMQGLKGVLQLQGVCRRNTAPPISPLDDAQMEQLSGNLRNVVSRLQAAGVANPGQVIA